MHHLECTFSRLYIWRSSWADPLIRHLLSSAWMSWKLGGVSLVRISFKATWDKAAFRSGYLWKELTFSILFLFQELCQKLFIHPLLATFSPQRLLLLLKLFFPFTFKLDLNELLSQVIGAPSQYKFWSLVEVHILIEIRFIISADRIFVGIWLWSRLLSVRSYYDISLRLPL